MMTEPRAVSPCPRPPSSRLVLPGLALSMWLAAVQVMAQSAPSRAAAPRLASTPSTTTAPAKPRPRSARQFSEELVGILQDQKTPWQGYATYIRIFEEFAAREAAVRTGNERGDAAQARVVASLRQMTGLLGQMAAQTKVRDEIRRGTASVPFSQRQVAFANSGTEHRRLLGEFARLGASLPRTSSPATVRPLASSAVRATAAAR